MTEVAEYLMANYYDKYQGVPVPQNLEFTIERFNDHIVIVRDGSIKGVAVYLRLSDETFSILKTLDLSQGSEEMANRLFAEHGKNIHFIILTADSFRTIKEGMRQVIEKETPKTMSWFNPGHTRLHIRRF